MDGDEVGGRVVEEAEMLTEGSSQIPRRPSKTYKYFSNVMEVTSARSALP